MHPSATILCSRLKGLQAEGVLSPQSLYKVSGWSPADDGVARLRSDGTSQFRGHSASQLYCRAPRGDPFFGAKSRCGSNHKGTASRGGAPRPPSVGSPTCTRIRGAEEQLPPRVEGKAARYPIGVLTGKKRHLAPLVKMGSGEQVHMCLELLLGSSVGEG